MQIQFMCYMHLPFFNNMCCSLGICRIVAHSRKRSPHVFQDVRCGLTLSIWSAGWNEGIMPGCKQRVGSSPCHWRFSGSMDSTWGFFPSSRTYNWDGYLATDRTLTFISWSFRKRSVTEDWTNLMRWWPIQLLCQMWCLWWSRSV